MDFRIFGTHVFVVTFMEIVEVLVHPDIIMEQWQLHCTKLILGSTESGHYQGKVAAPLPNIKADILSFF